MKKDQIVTLLVVAGGGYLLYWYLTNYGPTGAVMNASGQKIAPSYWDSWFGGATATTTPAPTPTQTVNTLVPSGTQQPGTVITNPPPVQTTPTPTPSAATVQLPAPPGTTLGPMNQSTLVTLLQGASGLGASSTLNADQWSYYLTQINGGTGISGTAFDSIFFPSGRPSDPTQYPQYTATQFVSMIAGKGLSGLGALVNLAQQRGMGMSFRRSTNPLRTRGTVVN